METYLFYIGKSALAAGAFYLLFLALFQNQKHFRFNRIYLPVSLALSFVIPLITFTRIQYIEAVPVAANSMSFLPEINQTQKALAFQPEWFHYLFGIYILGAIGFFAFLLLGHGKAISIIKKSRLKKLFEIKVNITQKDVHPFSFFHKIVLSEKTLKNPNLQLIVEHEHIHVKENHTLDILFAELLFLLQWFNPFAWLLKDAIKNNLEYKTDQQITETHNPQTYQLAMVGLADKKGVAPFLTALNGSQLKNRIIMMKKKTENKYASVKQLLVLPLLAVLVMGLSNREVKTEIVSAENQVEVLSTTKVIKGKVTDPKGDPVSGATIIVKGKTVGTISDIEGKYELELENENETLVFMAVGLKEIQIPVEEKNRIDVQFKGENTVRVNTVSTKTFAKENKNIVKGKVTDQNGDPISGATIIIKGTTTGTITDRQGNYKIQLDNENATLVFWMLDYQKKEIAVAGQSKIDVELNQDKNANEDIIIRTYKSQQTNKEKQGEVFYKVDEMPQFPGGETALRKYIQNSIKYPEAALENGISGKVYVTFIIGKDGKVKDPKITRGVGTILDKEAIRVVSKLPLWKPGKQNGKIVNTYYTVPVEFNPTPEQLRKYNKVGWDGRRLSKKDYKYTVEGKVTNEHGEPIPGTSILLKGKTIGTVTNMQGEYELGMNEKNEILVFSMVGYEVKEVPANGKKKINVKLISDKNVKAGEVKVTGYSSKPAKIQINPSQENPPLYVVDGNEVTDITDLDPADIESIEVIKGESATELYGEKGKNGVVCIETKFKANLNDKFVIVDGKEYDGEINDISPEDIKSVSILKEKSATEVYGPKGKNGVIIIETKKEDNQEPLYFLDGKRIGVNEANNYQSNRQLVKEIVTLSEAEARLKYGSAGKNGAVEIYMKKNPTTVDKLFTSKSYKEKPLVIVDGKRFSDINQIDPVFIRSVNVLKDASATEKYGDLGENGVIEVTLKQPEELSQNEIPVVLNGKTIDKKLNEIDRNLIEKIKKLDPEEATKKYGDFGKFGVLEVSSRNVYTDKVTVKSSKEIENEKIDTELKLRKFIAKYVKYPVTAQEANIEETVYLALDIDKNGNVSKISDKSTTKLENYKRTDFQLDEVVVTSYKSENPAVIGYATKEEAEAGSAGEELLVNEAKRVFGKLPKIDIEKYKGKTIGVAVNFRLIKDPDPKAGIIDTELKLRKFLASNIRYPQEAIDKNIEGTVICPVLIDHEGNVDFQAFTISHDFDKVVVVAYRNEKFHGESRSETNTYNESKLLTDEIRRILKMIPKIEIEELKGKTVGIPVDFKLQEKE